MMFPTKFKNSMKIISTWYTNITHEDWNHIIKWVIEKAFYNDRKRYIFVSKRDASWNKRRNTLQIAKKQLLAFIDYLVDSTYVTVGNHRQIAGIPMGTDCAVFLANLYVYALEFEYLNNSMKTDMWTAQKFSYFRYYEDLLVFNWNGIMNEHKTQNNSFWIMKIKVIHTSHCWI